MGVMFTSDAEKQRVENSRRIRASKSWELLKTTSLVEAVRYARDNGWENKKVQVRAERYSDHIQYYVEPFERDCSCPNILKFADYFDPQEKVRED